MFGVYSAVQAVFHFSEFLSIAWVNPSTLSIDTFVLNHSVAYGIAACSSWLEFVLERHYFPEMKEASFVSYSGLLLCVCGDALRKLAMFTAKHNFNHNVQCEKMDDHELVTHGVYRLCRHPSYMGWFYWSIGTQVISCTSATLNGRNVEETKWPWYLPFTADTPKSVLLPGVHGSLVEVLPRSYSNRRDHAAEFLRSRIRRLPKESRHGTAFHLWL